jgi:hypothetical protein
MSADDLLKYLLTAADDPRLASLKAALTNSVPVFLDASTGDGTPLLRIYSIKSGIAKDRGTHTEGYQDLLSNLQGAQNRQVACFWGALGRPEVLTTGDRKLREQVCGTHGWSCGESKELSRASCGQYPG